MPPNLREHPLYREYWCKSCDANYYNDMARVGNEPRTVVGMCTCCSLGMYKFLFEAGLVKAPKDAHGRNESNPNDFSMDLMGILIPQSNDNDLEFIAKNVYPHHKPRKKPTS